MRLLSVDDLGFDGEGGGVYMCYQQQEETWAAEGLRRLVKNTRGLGVMPVYENHAKPGAWTYTDFSQPPDIFLEIVRRTADGGLGVNF